MVVAGLIAAVLAACPDDGRVADGLARAAPKEVRDRYRWAVTVTGDAMRVALLDGAGAVVREKVVPASPKCSERETVAIAVLGAWLVTAPEPEPVPAPAPVEAVPEKKPVVRAPPPAPAPAPTPTPPPPEAVAPTWAGPPPEGPPAPEEPLPPPPVVDAPAPAPAPVPVLPAEPPEPAPELSLRFELALDARAHYAHSAAPGVGLTASVGSKLAGFVEGSTATARSLALGPGQVRWFRVAVGLGVRYRFDLGPLYLEPAVSLEGAWLRLEGQGFMQNYVTTGFDGSVCAQARAGRPLSEVFTVYLGLRGCAWPLQGKVTVTGVSANAPLPTFELAAMLGISGGYGTVKGPAPMRPSEK
ncbi:MAG: hypothetical protein JNK82_33190 [Myxococcaceae bacterium]|nr:hypothetical protein [Myxococcaceae bacterium]